MSGVTNDTIPLYHWSNFQNTPFLNTGIGDFPAFNSTFTPSWPTAFTSTDSTTNVDSYEVYKKKREEERQKHLEELERTKQKEAFYKEKSEQLTKSKELIEFQEKRIQALNRGQNINGKIVIESTKIDDPKLKEDGTLDKSATKPKKKGFWNHLCAWGSSAVETVKNMGKAFIGWDDEKGSINWGTFAKNIAIAAAVIGATCIPGIGPIIGTTLLYGGLASGIIGGGIGIYNYAKSDNEIDDEKARQEIIGGGITAALSAIGLRGVGQAANATSQTASNAGLWSKTIQLGKDIFINPIKATRQAVTADKALIAAKSGGIKGFGKAWRSKVSSAWEGLNNWESQYNKQYKEMETNLNQKLTDINSKLCTETNPAKKALLNEQKLMVENNLNELRSMSNLKTKTEFEHLKNTNSSTQNYERLSSYTQNSKGGYEIDGHSIAQQRFEAFKAEMEAMQKTYKSGLEDLIKKKDYSMQQFAKNPEKHQRAIDEYTQKNIRQKYNTPEKQATGLEQLNNKLSKVEEEIVKLTEKISQRRSRGQSTTSLERQLATKNHIKMGIEDEISVCSSIKFSSWLKPSTWRKNDYQLCMDQNSYAGLGLFTKQTGQFLTSPTGVAGTTYAQYSRDFSAPMLGTNLRELTQKEKEEYLQQYEQEKKELEDYMRQLEEIKTVEEWTALKSKQQAALEAQAAAQAQAALDAQAAGSS